MQAKCTLSTNRVVILREFELRHQRAAVEVAGARANNNQALLGMLIQDEILKQLVVSIDGEKVSRPKLETIDRIFSAVEYRELMKVIEQMVGEAATPKIEMVNSSGDISHGSADTQA